MVRKIIFVLILFMNAFIVWTNEQILQEFKLGDTVSVSVKLPKNYKKLITERKTFAVFELPKNKNTKGVLSPSITFSYVGYKDFTTSKPYLLSNALSEDFLFDMIDKNNNITGDEILEELNKPDTRLIKNKKFFYETMSEYKYIKFKSGLEGVSYFLIDFEQNLLGTHISYNYNIVLPNGLLIISISPGGTYSTDDFARVMSKYGKMINGYLIYEGQAQVDKIYSDIKAGKSPLEGAYANYKIYKEMIETLKISITAKNK